MLLFFIFASLFLDLSAIAGLWYLDRVTCRLMDRALLIGLPDEEILDYLFEHHPVCRWARAHATQMGLDRDPAKEIISQAASSAREGWRDGLAAAAAKRSAA